MNKYKKVAVAFLLPILMFAVVTPALADNSGSNTNDGQLGSSKQESTKKIEAARQRITQQHQEAKDRFEQHKEKLAGDKLKFCQMREKHINGSMIAISSRGQEKLNLFTKIADRTEAFYVAKGKVLSNYDDLVASVNSEKAAAQSAVDTVKADKAAFKCIGDNPKGTANLFKADLQSMNDALKSYRTAVKNLIIGVKSVQSTTKTDGSH